MKVKQTIPGIADRPLADMDSGGVYFEKENEKKDKPDNSICEYSGLPSVWSYGDKKEEEEYVIGHS